MATGMLDDKPDTRLRDSHRAYAIKNAPLYAHVPSTLPSTGVSSLFSQLPYSDEARTRPSPKIIALDGSQGDTVAASRLHGGAGAGLSELKHTFRNRKGCIHG